MPRSGNNRPLIVFKALSGHYLGCNDKLYNVRPPFGFPRCCGVWPSQTPFPYFFPHFHAYVFRMWALNSMGLMTLATPSSSALRALAFCSPCRGMGIKTIFSQMRCTCLSRLSRCCRQQGRRLQVGCQGLSPNCKPSTPHHVSFIPPWCSGRHYIAHIPI